MNAGQNDPKDIDSSEHEDTGEAPIPLEPDTTEPETAAVPLAPELEEPKAESKARVFFRKLFRWSLGILIIFGIGFAAAVYTVYTPAVAEQKITVGELADAQAQITDLSAQISALDTALQESDAKLLEQSKFELHIAVLNARVDVANARLMIAEDNAAGAQLALEKTAETLARIKSLMPVAQGEVVTSMEQRLELVLTEIAENPFAAGSDLNVLATDLLQLEDATFGSR